MFGALALSTAMTLCMPLDAAAFESDVHFGLTDWLAVQAGYTTEQATAIATGDQRVDSGDVQFTDMLSVYACNAHDVVASNAVRAHHFPSAVATPNAPEQRIVEPGSAAARKPLDVVLQAAPKRETYLLYKLGEGLHVLQDSWSDQGVPSVPALSPDWFACDASLAWGPPTARGGWTSHRSDLTAQWPVDVTAMAAASYEALMRYPSEGASRVAKPWKDLLPELDGFIRATTKSAKAEWFAAHGVRDVSFLEGVSLPDGTKPFTATWSGRHLPPLSGFASQQHDVDPRLLRFFDAFFVRWLESDDFSSIATDFMAPTGSHAGKGRPNASGPSTTIDRQQFVARLKLWRLRDHGAVADLALQAQLLAPRQVTLVNTAAAKPEALVHVAATTAVLPVMANTPDATPLLPYLINRVATPASAPAEAVATIKFRHAPYDTVEVLAEETPQGWRVRSIGAFVEH